jgi:hypothetical protein
MAMLIEDLEGFGAAEEVLTATSKALNNRLNRATPSTDPASDFQKLDEALRKILDARMALAAKRLQQIDAGIAASGIIDEIDMAAADAKREADRIKKATRFVTEMVHFVDEITGHLGLVGKILSL